MNEIRFNLLAIVQDRTSVLAEKSARCCRRASAVVSVLRSRGVPEVAPIVV